MRPQPDRPGLTGHAKLTVIIPGVALPVRVGMTRCFSHTRISGPHRRWLWNQFCHRGERRPVAQALAVRSTTVSNLVHELHEAQDDRRLPRLQDRLTMVSLLVDELGYVSFQQWNSVFSSKRLIGTLLDRITHDVHILEVNTKSYRLRQHRSRLRPPPG